MADVDRVPTQGVDRAGGAQTAAPDTSTTPGPLDLPPDPPAVVDLLVHDGSPSENALPATVLDLAARRIVHLEETAPAQYMCRLPAHVKTDGLLPFELRVLDLLQRRPSGEPSPQKR